MSASTVRIYINSALEYLDSPYRVDDVEPNLQQAEQRIPNLDPDEAAPFIAQIADIRARLDEMVSPADARQVSAAQGKIRQARDFIDTNGGQLTQSGKDHVEELFRGADQFLSQIADERKADKLKAPVLDEIAQIRSQYGTNYTAPPPPPKAATPPPPSENFYSAKRAVFWANEYFTSPGRGDQVEPELVKAEGLLQGDYSAEAAGLTQEIADLREKVANVVSSEDLRYIKAAEGKLRQIRDHVERNSGKVYDSDKEYFEELMRGAVDFLNKITHPRKAEQLKEPVLTEISRMRTQYGITGAAAVPQYQHHYQAQPQEQTRSAPQYTSPPPPDMNTLSYDDQDRLNRAKRTIVQARSNIESRRTDGVENLFSDATNLMAPVSAAHKDHLIDEIEQLRKDLEATRLSESTRIITGELDRKLSGIEDDIDYPDRVGYSIRSFKQRFEQDEVRRTLGPDLYRDYENRLANVLAAGNARVKAEKLARANPALQTLHDKLATNPFMGLEQYEANRVDGELRSMRWQVEKEIKELPEDDADRLRLYKELEDTDAQFAAYSNEWAKTGTALVYCSV